VLQELGASTHLAHPSGVKAFCYRRVKNDVRDATDLADLLRMGRLPEAWIAPPATRELRELVRHRAKLVAIRSGCKCEVHAVLAKCGIQVLMSDLFAEAGTALLERLDAPAPYLARVGSLRRLIDDLDPAGPRPAGRRPRLPGGPTHSRHRTDLGCGVRRRDRGRAPVPWAGTAGLMGGADPETS
jgi:transposase